jgi:hypothetical protein
MRLTDRFGAVKQPNNTITYDNGTVDCVSFVGEDGLVVQRPIAITPEEERDRSVRDLRRALESVAFREQHVAEVMPWEEPMSADKVERKRSELANERAFILAELDRLDPDEPVKPRKGRR